MLKSDTKKIVSYYIGDIGEQLQRTVSLETVTDDYEMLFDINVRINF